MMGKTVFSSFPSAHPANPPCASVSRRRPASSWVVGASLLACVWSHSGSAHAAARAFPAAEGFGAMVTGGRGGTVVHVTNLNDTGAGSLRDAVSVGNRIVVFDVGGLITIASPLVIKGDNVTVAGQTAPGPGITIYGDGSSASNRKNVILRYLRFRQGYDSDSGTKALNVTDGSNMIFDHVSVQWGRWDTIGFTGSSSTITVQYSLLGESIDPQRFGGLVDGADQVTLSHNLWMDSQSRSPKFKANGQYINNVVYNWGANGLGGGHSGADWYQDVINNYFIKGPSSTGGFATLFASTDHVFNSGNLADLDMNGSLNGRAVVASDFTGDTPPTFGTAAHNTPAVAVTVQSPSDAYASVVASAGDSLCRDAIDKRLLAQVLSLGTKGGIIVNESAVGGQPQVTAASRAANFDTDRDGISDAWETAHGLNPASASDASADPDGDGYSNLEDYLNALANAGVDSCGSGTPVGGGGSGGAAGVAGATGAAGAPSNAGAGAPGNGGSSDQNPSDAAGAQNGGSPSNGSAGAGASSGAPTTPIEGGAPSASGATSASGSDAAPSASPAADSSGCGCRVLHRPTHGERIGSLLLLVFAGLRLRKRSGKRLAQRR